METRCSSRMWFVAACVAQLALATVLATLGWYSAPQNNPLLHRSGPMNLGLALDTCSAYLGSEVPRIGISVILTADPGEFSGVSEAHFIIENVMNRVEKDASETVCGGHYYGYLMGQPVLVITTGIGPSAASLCTKEVLDNCGEQINDIIYFGTSGWSPQLGGILSPPDCEQPPRSNGKITRLGDVCVSPFAVNWVCKKATWDMQSQGSPNQCTLPQQQAGPNSTFLFGRCEFYKDNAEANLDLAAEVLRGAATSGQGNFPVRRKVVHEAENKYWRAMSEGTGLDYKVAEPAAPPSLWGWNNCMEVDGQFFYSGVPWEAVARQYATDVVNAYMATESGVKNCGSKKGCCPATTDKMIAVAAMEAVGVNEALEKYHELSTTKNFIPYTHIRTASNWVHQPVTKVGNGEWRVFKDIVEDFETGYQYAIASGSAVVMSTYQARCYKALGELEGKMPDICSFEIDY